MMPPITLDAPVMPPMMLDAPVMPPVTLQVHPPWWAPCWKFEKLQTMPLGFRYLESLEKSEKKYTNTTL